MEKIIFSIQTATFGNKILFSFLLMNLIYIQNTYCTNNRVNDRTKIYTRDISADSVILKIDNDFAIPVSAKLILELANLQSDSSSQILAIVPAKSIGYILARFRKKNPANPYKCSYKWNIVLGDVTKTADYTHIYQYPFIKGNIYKISQGPGGEFSHNDMFAYDFLMPAGTPVTAARDGVVALIKADSFIGGADKKYTEDANYISVYHTDGTIASYYHLNTNGVAVKEGQTVKSGQVIGYSGNTGFSSGPHLHFELTQPRMDLEKKKWLAFTWEVRTNNIFTTFLKNNFINVMITAKR